MVNGLYFIKINLNNSLLNSFNPSLFNAFNKHLDTITSQLTNTEFTETNNVSVLTGFTSNCIFYEKLALFKPELKPQLKKLTKDNISNILDYIENNEISSFNIDGLVGFGWAVSHLCNSGFLDEDANDILSELDYHLFNIAINDIENNNFDFFYGGLGYGNYFLNRSKSNPINSKYLQEIGKTLIKTMSISSNDKNKIIWQNNSDVESKVVDFSISHGLSSIIIFLSNLIALDITPKYYRPIVKSLCSQLLNHKENNRIPDCLENDKPIYSPLRWCHGELGIVSALAYASKILNDKVINEAAHEIAKNIAHFKIENQKLVSVNICHGTLGVAHVFQKWYHHYWQSPEIRDAALYWYKQSNDIINSDIGFKYFDDDGVFREKNGILFGIEGMGLAIISALNNKLTDWDSFILLHDLTEQ